MFTLSYRYRQEITNPFYNFALDRQDDSLILPRDEKVVIGLKMIFWEAVSAAGSDNKSGPVNKVCSRCFLYIQSVFLLTGILPKFNHENSAGL